jgi:hypothetical protein
MKELTRFADGTVSKAKAIMRRYVANPPPITLDQVVSVEQEYEIIISDQRFTRRLDLVFNRDDGIHVMDHKTTADLKMRQKSAGHDLALATQVVIARRLWGNQFKQFWLNLISTTEPKNLCIPLTFNDGFLDNVNFTVAYYLKQINSFKSAMFTAPRSWQCRVGYYTCDYWNLCMYGSSALVEYNFDETI